VVRFFFSSGGGLVFFVPNVFPIASHFIILNWIWLAHWNKVETMEASHNRNFCGTMECLLLWPTYIGEKFGQNIWD
jgi:hypothetical protein